MSEVTCKICNDSNCPVYIIVNYNGILYDYGYFCVSCVSSRLSNKIKCLMCGKKCSSHRELYIEFEGEVVKVGYSCLSCDPVIIEQKKRKEEKKANLSSLILSKKEKQRISNRFSYLKRKYVIKPI